VGDTPSRSNLLFASWKSWCEDRNQKPGTATAFSLALGNKGYKKLKRDGQSGFVMLSLNSDQGRLGKVSAL
jgi:hypothetical protein